MTVAALVCKQIYNWRRDLDWRMNNSTHTEHQVTSRRG